MNTYFLIWSIEHSAWWQSERCGYTTELFHAGLYTAAEAKEICDDANIVGVHECAIPANYVLGGHTLLSRIIELHKKAEATSHAV